MVKHLLLDVHVVALKPIIENVVRQPAQSEHTSLPGSRPAVCSCTRSCQPQYSSEPLPGDWTRQSFPLPPLEKTK